MCLRRLCLLCGGGRSSRVEAGRRGWSSPGHLAAKAGGGGGSGRQRGLLPSTPASSPMMRARPSRSAPNSRWRRKPSSTTRPKGSAPARRAPETTLTLVSARRSEGARCPKRRRSAQVPCSATPKRTGNTTKTPGHRMVSWRYPGHRGFNPLRFGHIQPNNPINHPLGSDTRGPRISLGVPKYEI